MNHMGQVDESAACEWHAVTKSSCSLSFRNNKHSPIHPELVIFNHVFLVHDCKFGETANEKDLRTPTRRVAELCVPACDPCEVGAATCCVMFEQMLGRTAAAPRPASCPRPAQDLLLVLAILNTRCMSSREIGCKCTKSAVHLPPNGGDTVMSGTRGSEGLV